MNAAKVARRIGLDLALWYCAPAAFLLAYILRYSEPSAAVLPHLRVVALPLAALFLMRLAIARLSQHRMRAYLLAATAVTSLALGAMLVYYAVAVIGLQSWGGVVAWNVIPSFFAEAREMADAIGLSPTLAAGLPVPFYAVLFGLCWLYLRRFDWAFELARTLSSAMLTTVVVSGAGVLAVESYGLATDPWIQAHEPVSLTLFPSPKGFDLEGLTLDPVRASNLDRLQDAARARYLPASGKHRNLIIIVVDALRPDHMGIYGYPRNTTPNLARIVMQHPTELVRGVHSSCGDTICGLMSLFSSRFPRDFSLRPMTLHEVLRRNGYRVHLILSGDHTYFDSLRGLYGQVDSFYDGTHAHGYFVNDDQLVIDHLASMSDWNGRPEMFQFHLMSAHILRKIDPQPGPFEPALRYVFHDSRDTGPGGRPLPSAVNFYDNGVLNADTVINSLLQLLQKKGFLTDALVVITADHGESLGEHGLFVHANSVREELLRIPLVLISFGYQPQFPRTIREFSSQVDIAPTILVDLGLPIPQTWSGRALQGPSGPDFSYFREHAYMGLIDHRDPRNVWKYWIDRNSGRAFAFDLSVDPHENHEALASVPDELSRDWRADVMSPVHAMLVQR